MGQVRVTLLAPWGQKDTLVMQYDHTPATRITPPKPDDESTYTFTYGATRYRKGKPIVYPASGVLTAGDPQNNSCLMPEEVAKHFFGDWNIVQGEERNEGDPRASWGVERNRVFKVWGDYRYDFSRPSSDHTPLAPPNMPYVMVQRIDDRGGISPDWEFYPRAYWECPEPTQAPGRPAELILAQDVDIEKLYELFKAKMAAESKAAPSKRVGRPVGSKNKVAASVQR